MPRTDLPASGPAAIVSSGRVRLMSTMPLQPGEKVIALAATALVAGALAALAAGLCIAWSSGLPLGPALGLITASTIVGMFFGALAGRLMFPAGRGQLRVVRAGRGALTTTFRATIVPGLLGALLSLATAWVLAGVPPSPLLVGVALLPALVVGALVGVVAALL